MTISGRITAAMVALALASVAGTVLAVASGVAGSVATVDVEQATQRVSSVAEGLDAYVAGARADVLVAADAARVGAMLEPTTRDAATRARVLDVFDAEMRAHPHYLQLRLIGVERGGREIVRVERTEAGGPLRVVPDPELQAKGDRGYFRDTLRMGDREVHVTPVELNQEEGAIQTPHVPVLRAGTPIRGLDGRVRGMVIVNVDMRPALQRAREQAGPHGRLYVVDERGSFLVHPDRSREFAADLGRGPRASDELPWASELLVAERPRGMDGDVLAAVAPTRLAGGPRVAVLSSSPSSGGAARRSAWTATLAPSLVAALLAVLAALWIARSLIRPLAEMTVAADKITRDEPAHLPLTAAGEMGTLARALARMKEAIREQNAALEAQHRWFEGIVEAAPNAKVVVDAEGKITLANRAAERLFGYPRAELLGAPIELLVPAPLRAVHREHVAAFQAAAEARGMGVGRDLYLCRKDGAEVPVEIGLAPIEGAGGMSTLASILDISERKRHEHELRRSNAELENFAYVASHDLQEPLRMVASYTELLAQRYEGQLDEKADKYIHYAVDGARRMQGLVADLLRYSRVGSQGKPLVPVASDEALAQVLQSLGKLIDETRAEIDVGPLPIVLADEGQLRQLFQNLVGNALKFRGEEAPRIVISAARENAFWRFSIEDNGIGIEVQYADRIFQMFQRLHARGEYEGSGIGLALAKRIVERHGGHIGFESEPGRGTTFSFTLLEAGTHDEHSDLG